MLRVRCGAKPRSGASALPRSHLVTLLNLPVTCRRPNSRLRCTRGRRRSGLRPRLGLGGARAGFRRRSGHQWRASRAITSATRSSRRHATGGSSSRATEACSRRGPAGPRHRDAAGRWRRGHRPLAAGSVSPLRGAVELLAVAPTTYADAVSGGESHGDRPWITGTIGSGCRMLTLLGRLLPADPSEDLATRSASLLRPAFGG